MVSRQYTKQKQKTNTSIHIYLCKGRGIRTQPQWKMNHNQQQTWQGAVHQPTQQ